MTDLITIRSSIWDRSPTVRWLFGSEEITVTLEWPLAGISHAPLRRQIIVVTGTEGETPNELLFYSYTGKLEFSISSAATNLPRCLFGYAAELPNGEIEACVSYEGAKWNNEHAGILDLKTGTLSDLHIVR